MKLTKGTYVKPSKDLNRLKFKPFDIKIYSQNSRGLRPPDLEEILMLMDKNNIFAWTVQETWMLGSSILQHSEGFVSLHHGPTEKLCRRGSLGVAIFLSPLAWKGAQKAGTKIHYYGDRIIAVSIIIKDGKGKDVKLRIISAYAPDSSKKHDIMDEYEFYLEAAIASCDDVKIRVKQQGIVKYLPNILKSVLIQ